MLEEAAKRDHRKLGREMDSVPLCKRRPADLLGIPTAGACSTQLIKPTCAASQDVAGYVEVNTPRGRGSQALWETSGHWDNYTKRTCSSPQTMQSTIAKSCDCAETDELSRAYDGV